MQDILAVFFERLHLFCFIKNGEDDIFNIHGVKVNIGKRVLIIHSPKASKISHEKDRYRIVSRSKKIEIEYEKK